MEQIDVLITASVIRAIAGLGESTTQCSSGAGAREPQFEVPHKPFPWSPHSSNLSLIEDLELTCPRGVRHKIYLASSIRCTITRPASPGIRHDAIGHMVLGHVNVRYL